MRGNTKMNTSRRIINEKIIKINGVQNCYGCGRKFQKGESMSSAQCSINGNKCRKYFCEGCHHTMVTKNITIDKFWYGDLLRDALTYEKSKVNIERK